MDYRQEYATWCSDEYFDAEKAGYSGAIGVFIFFFIMLISYALNGYFKRKGDALR